MYRNKESNAMKKRDHERITLDLEVTVLQANKKYSGTVKNISQNGMYIETDEPLPFNSKLDLHIPFKTKLKILINFNNEILEVPVRVKRLIGNGHSFHGMGVMLSTASYGYLDFMSNLAFAN
jgi:hypothetical protein